MNADQLIRQATTVYSLPHIYYLIDEAINNPNSSTGQLADIISDDTGLSARLLKLANSAFYSYPQKIDTISQAVTIIGTEQLRDLALATSVIQLFEGIPPEVVDMESFWRHSIACGVAARLIAEGRGESNIESFFVSGILHDIGALIIYSNLNKERIEIFKYRDARNVCMREAETQILGYDHAKVAGLLLDIWKLPKNLVEGVRCHHQPGMSRLHKEYAYTLHIADIIAEALQLGNSGESRVPPMDGAACRQLELSEKDLPSLLQRIEAQYNDAVKYILKETN